ncbi:MAG: energy transducer TonB [Bacteroidetes bacterium]|nr:energy transducer TonB [Bacteroidota bacterium]
MPIIKTPEADIRRHWKLYMETSVSIVLGLLVLGFYFFPDLKNQTVITVKEQEAIKIEEIAITKQEVKPPPPPRPQVPVLVPNDAVIDDEIVFESELDVSAPPPPPPPPTVAEEEEAAIFEVVEELPEIVGGLAAIQKAIVYPEIAKRAGIEGTVVIRAAINEKGDVIKAVVAKGIGAGCDEAATEAVMKAKFKPGSQRGKPVKVWLTIPVRFKLKS